MQITAIISTISLVFSGIALYFTFKKDAHRIRLVHRKFHERYLDTVAINNDSGFSVRLAAIGHINQQGKITWLQYIGNATTNSNVDLPILLEARSTFFSMVTHNIHSFPQGAVYGFCVQLSCGRTSITSGNLPNGLKFRLKVRELISWLSSGSFGFPRSNLPYASYLT